MNYHRIDIDQIHDWPILVNAWGRIVSVLSGADAPWTKGPREGLVDRNYGESLSFQETYSRPNAELTIRVESHEEGNPRDGWGYASIVRLVIHTPAGEVEMTTSQTSYQPTLRDHTLVFSGALAYPRFVEVKDELNRVLGAS